MSQINYSQQDKRFCLELDRIKLLLQKLKYPEKKLCIVHVAGTNGKGSVCSFIEAGLISMGVKCGCFVSPELFVPEDSIRINGQIADKKKLQNILKKIGPLSKEIEAELGKAPSPFEKLFAAALVLFRREKCGTVILECGMGGIGDATNAIDHNDISVFSSIGIDHADYLGSTQKEIAQNKCGIIRENTTVISAEQPLDAEMTILNACREKNCQLKFVKPLKINRMEGLNAVCKLNFGELKLNLAGCHQAQNCAVAIAVLDELGASEKDIVSALSGANHKARLEEIKPGIFFDGAHNPDGVRAMVDTINMSDIGGKISFAVGFMADKDIAGCFDELKKLKLNDIEIFTSPVLSNPRSETAEKIKDIALEKGFKATECANIRQAVKMAKRTGGAVFVFGSLYMYKEIMGEGGEQQKNENR